MQNTSYKRHVLTNMSTHPIIVPIEDYCRDNNYSPEDVEKWESFEQNSSQLCQNAYVIIKVYYKKDDWKCN